MAWLGITALHQRIEDLSKKNHSLSKENSDLKIKIQQIANSFRIALDISHPANIRYDRQSKSWGMVVIRLNSGESEMRYFRIPGEWTVSQIREFTKQFKQIEIDIDAPVGMGKYIRSDLF